MAAVEIHVEMLLGRRVLAMNGKTVGHLEEIVASLREGSCFIEEFHVGSYAVLERLAALSIGRVLLKIFGANKGYRVPWDKLDLSDPSRPRLLCPVTDLQSIA